MIVRKAAAAIILLAATGIMVYSGMELTKTEQVYRQGRKAYESLSTIAGIDTESDAAKGGVEAWQTDAPKTYIPQLGIDFDALQAFSADVAAWLYCPGTVINYPVMKANDYDYYLHHLPDGTENANGALFIDYNNAADFSDSLTVIYGHNMRSKSMFGSLKGYREQEYFEKHPFIYLYTRQDSYRIELLYGFVVSAELWRERGFMFDENVDLLLEYASRNTTFESGVSYSKGDGVIALSTCSGDFDGARYVAIGLLRRGN